MDKSKDDELRLKPYRPWNTSTLEGSVKSNNSKIEFSEDSYTDKDIRNELIPQLEELYLDDSQEHKDIEPLNINTDTEVSETTDVKPSSSGANLAIIKNNIERLLGNKVKEFEDVKTTINNPDNAKLLVGGFFKPVINTPSVSAQRKKINYLIKDLEKKEYEIQILTNNLKTAQALEHAEISEKAKQDEVDKREELEDILKQVTAERDKVSSQFRQAKSEIGALLEEKNKTENLLQHTEQELSNKNDECYELTKQTNKLEENFYNIKSELNEEISSNKQQIDYLSSELNNFEQKYSAAIHKMSESEKEVNELQNENNQLNTKLNEKDYQLQNLTAEFDNANEKLDTVSQAKLEVESELEEKIKLIQKLEAVIDTEQKLRKLSENKAKKLADELKVEQEKIIGIKNKAKAAISQANNTVLELLESQSKVDLELDKD